MKYVVYALAGAAAGILGGMGMGGGTLLIPLLLAAGGVGQHGAQAVNLVAFVPMAAVALVFHIKNKLVDFRSLPLLVLPGAAFSAAFSYIAANVGGKLLGRIFGGFLIAVALAQAAAAFRTARNKKKED